MAGIESPDNGSLATSPWRLAFVAAGVFAIVLASTSRAIPVVWDEGEYLWRSDLIVSWFKLGLGALSPSAIHAHWIFIDQEEGHPAFAAIAMAAAKALFGGLAHPLTAARIGTIAVFSAACGVVAFRLRQTYGAVAAVSAVVALLTFPRIFSEAHFATLDAQLTRRTRPGLSPGPRLGFALSWLRARTGPKGVGWRAEFPKRYKSSLRKRTDTDRRTWHRKGLRVFRLCPQWLAFCDLCFGFRSRRPHRPAARVGRGSQSVTLDGARICPLASARPGGQEMASVATRPENKLLRLLDLEGYRRLAPKLKVVALHAKQVLYRPKQQIDRVYFPDDAVICLMTVMENGDTLETATVGREGASWISASIGAPSMPCETIVVIGGTAHALNVDDLDVEMQENHHFRDVLTQYSHALLIHSMRMTGCTGLHSLEQRCARWMLTTLDRVPQNAFSITHEFLAMLLGASRPSVSTVIEKFQKRGILTIERGQVTIGNRERLLELSCDCYQVIKGNYDQVGQ